MAADAAVIPEGTTDFAAYRHEGVSEEELTPDYFL